MNYQNKIYVVELTVESMLGKSYFSITVAASDIELAKQYVKEKIGIEADPIWLMNAVYPTIYTSDGSRPAPVQAKILFNANCHYRD